MHLKISRYWIICLVISRCRIVDMETFRCAIIYMEIFWCGITHVSAGLHAHVIVRILERIELGIGRSHEVFIRRFCIDGSVDWNFCIHKFILWCFWAHNIIAWSNIIIILWFCWKIILLVGNYGHVSLSERVLLFFPVEKYLN